MDKALILNALLFAEKRIQVLSAAVSGSSLRVDSCPEIRRAVQELTKPEAPREEDDMQQPR